MCVILLFPSASSYTIHCTICCDLRCFYLNVLCVCVTFSFYWETNRYYTVNNGVGEYHVTLSANLCNKSAEKNLNPDTERNVSPNNSNVGKLNINKGVVVSHPYLPNLPTYLPPPSLQCTKYESRFDMVIEIFLHLYISSPQATKQYFGNSSTSGVVRTRQDALVCYTRGVKFCEDL